jgi:hypothetical protein
MHTPEGVWRPLSLIKLARSQAWVSSLRANCVRARWVDTCFRAALAILSLDAIGGRHASALAEPKLVMLSELKVGNRYQPHSVRVVDLVSCVHVVDTAWGGCVGWCAVRFVGSSITTVSSAYCDWHQLRKALFFINTT